MQRFNGNPEPHNLLLICLRSYNTLFATVPILCNKKTAFTMLLCRMIRMQIIYAGVLV